MLTVADFASRTSATVTLLRQLVEIESPSTDKAAVDRLGTLVAGELRRLGAAVTIDGQAVTGDHVIGRWGSGPAGILVMCHLDTVYDLGTLARQPCRETDGKLTGPGVYDNFVAALADQVRTIKWGDPAEGDDIEMGSLIAGAHADKVQGMVDRARGSAEVVLGGERPDRAGAYYAPTIIAGPDQKSEIIQDEIFGPVVTVQRFTDEDQAVQWANDTPYGLASSIFTSDIGKAMRVGKALDFGHVWINEHFTLTSETPHGGVKQSGWGKDGSKYALEDYTFVKHLMINTGT